MALAMGLDDLPGRVWVLMGDSEVAEGSVWEAMENASFHQARNLIGILDMNRLGQRGPTMLQWEGDRYAARAESFGWRALRVDGHDVAGIDQAYREAEDGDGPTLIVARTEKGHGVSFLANKEGWHGKALSPDEAEKAIAELGGARDIVITPQKPDVRVDKEPVGARAGTPVDLPVYEEAQATRKAFGEALAALAARPDVVALDGEVANSTHTEDFQKVAPERFFEMYIAEQAMLGAAVGFQAVGKNPFAATFGAFLTRAYDFVRMAAVSRANLRLCGSHAGVSIGEDGPSQMALEDLAMMRAVHGSTVLYPADAQRDRDADEDDGRPAGHRVPAHHAREDREAVRRGRGVPRGRQQDAALQRRRPRHAGERRRHAVRIAVGRGRAGRRGHRVPRDRRLLDQADRRRRRCGPRWPTRASS